MTTADGADPASVAVAVASGNSAKLAALYFDYVVPVYCDDIPREVLPPMFGDWEPTTSTHLLRRIQKRTGRPRVAAPVIDANGEKQLVRLTDAHGAPDLDALEYVNQWYFVNKPELQARLREQMRQAMIDGAPVLLSTAFVDRARPAQTLSDVAATVAGLPLVAVDTAPWEQILEFRNDPKSRDQLRRLRLTLTRDYVGESAEQIEAAVALGLEAHERATKKHGFELLVGSMQTACDARTLLGSAGLGALIGSLAGTPVGATMGALVGISLEVAKMSLTVAKGIRDMAELRRYHPLSYVMEARRRFGTNGR